MDSVGFADGHPTGGALDGVGSFFSWSGGVCISKLRTVLYRAKLYMLNARVSTSLGTPLGLGCHVSIVDFFLFLNNFLITLSSFRLCIL